MKKPLKGVVAILLASPLLTAAALPELSVNVQDGKIKLHAQSVPLYGVLWAISAQSGIKVNVPGGPQGSKLAELLVTDDFSDLSLEQGIGRLLAKSLTSSNYVIITDEKTGLPQSVHILPGEGAQASPSPSAAAAAESRPAFVDEPRADISVEQALDAARVATAPEQQVRAFRALGDFQDPRALEVLEPALYSDRADVRKAALDAMRGGAAAEDERTLATVRSVVATDADPGVRRAGLEVLVRYNEDPETRELLKRVAAEAGDADQRDFATRELGRMEAEQRARSLPDPQVRAVESE